MTFDLGCDLLTSSTKEAYHVVHVNLVWFQLDLNSSIETNFTFSTNFKTWPQMTFDFVMGPWTSSAKEASHVVPVNQVWFQLDLNFSIETNFTFSVNFKTWPQMTFWPWHVTFDLINKLGIPSCTHDPSLTEIHRGMWTVQANVNPFSQTTTDNNNSAQSDPYASFLLSRRDTKTVSTSCCK